MTHDLDSIRAIEAPTLIVHGRDDHVIPVENSLVLLHAIDNAQLHVFGRCGHWTQIEHADEFGEPFKKAGFDISKIFYCGESVLLKSHRGYGLGHAFFDGREAQAYALGGFTHSTFCRVVRPDDHPLKPADYAPLDPFWNKRGYHPVDGIVATYDWKDINQAHETRHQMQFWMKKL